ncbi:MAG: 3-deoxy-D-manno-octulosonic acid transferase [Bacteriovoracia bacterium]
MSSLRSNLYRKVVSGLSACVPGALAPSKRKELPDLPAAPRRRVWFHAASTGELESLAPVIQKWGQDPGHELILTIFSRSAERFLSRLISTLRATGVNILHYDYSPREGQWQRAIRALKPSAFVTAKYEAWPELWMSLADQGIPLVVLSARPRQSFSSAKGMLKLTGTQLPRILFLTEQAPAQSALREEFPAASVEICADPRWERALDRARVATLDAGAPRVQAIANLLAPGEKCAVLGSVWQADLDFWGACLKEIHQRLIVVPHEIDADHLRKCVATLEAQGLRCALTSRLPDLLDPSHCLVVDEMGFLAELYRLADWAYVGGGFGKGIHSTIEPAVYGIPVCVGPEGTARFAEVEELKETGQLAILNTSADLRGWLDFVVDPGLRARRQEWRAHAESKRGTSDRVLHLLADVLASS